MSDSSEDAPRVTRPRRTDPHRIGNWKIGRVIGQGSSGRVRVARNSITGQHAAVKIVSKTSVFNSRMSGICELGDDADQILLGIQREIVIMKLIDHPNIMRLYDFWETSSELFLILEYVEGGELFEYLCKKGALPTAEALGYFQQIICAVDYCHRFKIAHRDLKPENVLLDKDKNIKIADFGMAAWQVHDKSGLLRTACGSPHYAAPEVIRGEAYNGSMSDIWSCGIILYALLMGKLPFDDEDLTVLLEKIKSGKYTVSASMNPLAKDLLARMLELDVNKRITMDKILLHPFFVSQPPKQTCSSSVPGLDALDRPVGGLLDVDPEILRNLCTLWHESSKAEVLERLASDEQNLEKDIYRLLVESRTRLHRERNPLPGGKTLDNPKTRRTRTKDKEPPESVPQEPLTNPDDLRPRAAPPTPRKSAEKYVAMPSFDSFVQVANLELADGGNAQSSPRPRQSPGPTKLAPSVPVSVGPSSSSLFFSGPAFPRIGDLSLTVDPPSTPMLHSTPVSATSPVWNEIDQAPLFIPDMQDEKINDFLQQIVENLRAMDGGTPPEKDGHKSTASDPGHVTSSPRIERLQPLNASSDNSWEALCFHESELEEFEFPPSINANKENRFNPRRADTKAKSPRLRAALAPKPRQIKIVEPAHGPPSKLRRKAALLSGDKGRTRSESPPRANWFINPFRHKSAPYTLLSMVDKHDTFTECRRILLSMGVDVVEQFSDPVSSDFMLHCRLKEIRDASSLAVVLKTVTFKIEMHRPTSAQKAAGYEVELAIIQEKGASSTLKCILNRLRREWNLDAVDRRRLQAIGS